jgi:two-component SAPR family response regulator
LKKKKLNKTLKEKILEKAEHGQKNKAAFYNAPKHEKQKADELGGYLVSNSGRGKEKGDVFKKNLYRIDCKNTTANSYSIKKDLAKKLELESIGKNEIPIFVISFYNEVHLKYDCELAVMPLRNLKELLEKIDETTSTKTSS